MKVHALVAEIGSTTTVVNAFDLSKDPRFLGQGMSETTVAQGDVTLGLRKALDRLKESLGAGSLDYDRMMAVSSAAGGLSMSVHGLVYDMTVRAAKEAALGAGAVIRFITAGEMTSSDALRLQKVKPKIALLAGGVDYGEKSTALHNARVLHEVLPDVPIIYAGNIAARQEVADILKDHGGKVYFVENVFPRVDELVVEPARKVIQAAFEEHITKAPGMDTIREMVDGPIMPTPGAVMEACKVLWEDLGDLCALDVGGATTDVHSVAKGSPEIQAILENPEPLAKRTVEGDLGVFINAKNVYEEVKDRAVLELGFDPEPLLDKLSVIPSDRESCLVSYLTKAACEIAFSRHAGRIRYLYGPSGRQAVASGKDLSSVGTIIGTGGALTRLPGGEEILKRLIGQGAGRELYPKDARILIDKDYIMAACGVLSREKPSEAMTILKTSLGLV